ncbi:MAG TPA: hypothetical protein VMU59_10245 [Caulobacteraceae bacterium]|nr:hypothetical protein [Caulobacteraceae bacterium]
MMAVLAAAGAVCATRAQDVSWAPRRLPWYVLPDRTSAGSAPVSLPMPAGAGACGAASDRVEPFAGRGPVFLRVAFRVESGAVRIGLRSPDAAEVLSKEKTVTPEDGVVSVFFRVDPGDGPRVIVLCQAAAAGQDSRADVESLTAAKVEGLPADEAAKASVGQL